MILICSESDNMDTSFYVAPGDPLLPQSARRYNDISEVLNRMGHSGPSAPKITNGGESSTITCCNNTDDLIKAGTFVTFSGIHQILTPDDPASFIYSIAPGTADPCGVLLEDCYPKQNADVQISGLCEAAASPAPAGIMTIFRSGDKAFYLLNSTGSNDYNNYFKTAVADFSEGKITKLRVFDGADPESDEAGYTDIGLVRSAEIETQGKRYLCLKLESNYTQVFSMEEERPDYHLPAVILAEIVKNRLIQRWVGGMICWRNRFVIPSRFQEVWP